MKSYQSTAWVYIKGAWFVDFMLAFLQLVYQDREMDLPTVAKKAYDKALAPHHNWLIKSAARVGLVAASSRANFLKSLCEEQTRISDDGDTYTP